MKKQLIQLIDRFYFPFLRKWFPLQTFRYAAVGGMNMVVDAVLYFLIYHFVLHKQMVDLGFVVISPEIASFLIVFPVTFMTGLWLARNISFQNSVLGPKTQSFRYLLVVILNIGIKYGGLKLCTQVLNIYPSIANVLMTMVTILFSYLMSSYFTFKGHRIDP